MHGTTILHLVIPQICTTLQEIAWPSYPRMQSMIQLDFNPNSMELNFKSLQSAQHSRQSHLKAPSVYCVDLLIGRNLSYAQVKMLPIQSLFNPLNSDASPKTDQHLFQGTNQVVWQEQVRVSFTAWLQTLTEMTVKQILLSRECDFKIFQASAGHNSLSLLVAVLYLCAFFICMSAQTSWTWPEYQSPAPSWVVQSCGPETAKKPCTKNVTKIETVQTSSGRIKMNLQIPQSRKFRMRYFYKKSRPSSTNASLTVLEFTLRDFDDDDDDDDGDDDVVPSAVGSC